MEQVSGLDAAFLYCETPTMHLHVCGLLLLDPSTMPDGYSYERIRTMAWERLPQIPAVRRKLAKVPLNLGRPFWIDEPDLDIDAHLHRVVLEAPGDDRSLASVVGEIASSQLRRDRPLWEVWVIEGLADGHVAVLVKMHHSTIDGVSGANIMGRLLDLQPTPPLGSKSLEERQVERTPSPLELLGHSMIARLSEPLDLVRLVPATALRVATTAWRLGRSESKDQTAAIPFTAPRTSFNATVTGRRSVAFTDVSLSDIKMVKNAFGVTVNDVVTAVVGGALRHYLEDLGELPDRPLLAAAPISVHDRTTKLEGTTKLSVMFSTLATDEKDPVERLRIIASANSRAKEINNMVGADTFMRWAEHFWFNAIGLGARLYSTTHLADHHPVVHNLILSNVPGPPVALYFAGARLVGLYPLGPITDGAGLNVTVLSEEDRVGFGIITCPDLVPRVWDLADSIPGAVRELVEAAKQIS
ncbi:MAG: WS/DGAT/MGAT family O-acyltransferase [Acidimicrobiales bacterium]